jgi:hypothetical protein
MGILRSSKTQQKVINWFMKGPVLALLAIGGTETAR